MATHYKAAGEEVDAEGLDATVKKKLDAKYDHAVEAEVRRETTWCWTPWS